MARILNFFLDRKTNRHCLRFDSPERLFAGLQREESAAIECLSARISGSVFNAGKRFNLVPEDIEELLCDCITLFIQKIREGKYVFEGYDPASYVIEIAKNRVRNFSRSALRNRSEDFDPAKFDLAFDPEPGTLADTELLEKLLQQAGENCQNLIRLKYLEELPDKEILDRNLTQYNSPEALRNKRSACLKKLSELAAQIRQTI